MRLVSAVLLDVGGVLLLPSPEAMLPPLRSAGARPTTADLERAHYRATAAVETLPESDRWPGYLRAYVTACGVPGPARARAGFRALRYRPAGD